MIIGGGKTSYYLAKQLTDMNIDVKIIERDNKRCEELSLLLPDTLIIHGDGGDEGLLREEGIESIESFVPLTGLDEENILLTLFAKSCSDTKVITKINRSTFTNVIDSMDLGSVMYPRYMTSESIIRYVRAMQNSIGSNIETLYHIFDNRAEALEFKVEKDSPVIGIPLMELKLKDKLLLACIVHKGKIVIPRGNHTISAGDKVIVDKNLLYWYPEIEVGDFLKVAVEDGDIVYEKQFEVAAIGDYTRGFNNWNYLIMAQEGVEKLSENTLNFYYHIFAEEKYDEAVEKQLEEMVAESGLLNLRTWKDEYELSKSQMTVVSAACYAFLGILGAICIMNMINTMIHSVHVRKKEIGMLQAIGMSDAQVFRMLQIEGVFYTLGTLILSVGGGSLIGYPIFLWAKEEGILSINNYHYPVEAAIIVTVVLIVVQLMVSLGLSKSVKKESLIERIRFSE